MTRYAAEVTGGMFLAAALLLWLGWALLPVRVGAYLEPGLFPAIRKVFRPWIWLYRVHLLGYLVTVMAMVALVSPVTGDARLLVWPGAVVLGAGAIVAARAAGLISRKGPVAERRSPPGLPLARQFTGWVSSN